MRGRWAWGPLAPLALRRARARVPSRGPVVLFVGSFEEVVVAWRVGDLGRVLHRAQPAVHRAQFKAPLGTVPGGGLVARQERVNGD